MCRLALQTSTNYLEVHHYMNPMGQNNKTWTLSPYKKKGEGGNPHNCSKDKTLNKGPKVDST